MADTNLIQIGNLWCTSDGGSGGRRCLTRVSGLSAIKQTRTGSIHRALDGTPYRQTKLLKGFPVSITFNQIKKGLFDSLFNFINTQEQAGASFALNISGDTGDFNLNVIPDDNWLRFPGEFIEGWIYDATFAFRTT